MEDERYDADMPFLDKGFDKLLSYQLQNGGIYQDLLANYNTAIAISALAVSKEAEYKPAIAKGLNYLRSLQWSDQIEGVSASSRRRRMIPSTAGLGTASAGGRICPTRSGPWRRCTRRACRRPTRHLRRR